MPVIGRLDDQVDAVLIKPLTTKNAQPAQEDKKAPGSKGEQTVADAQSRVDDRNESSASKSGQREDLPVWLL